MSIYSKRLLSAGGLGGSISETVPSGVIWVVRDIDAVCDSGSDAQFEVHGAGGVTFWYAQYVPGNPDFWFGWRGRQILYAGEILTAVALSESWDVTISGYELTSP